MAAIDVVVKSTMEAGSVVQWDNSATALTDITTLVGAGNVRGNDDKGATNSIEVVLGGTWHTVNHLDYVFVGETEDYRVMSPAEYARYYELAP